MPPPPAPKSSDSPANARPVVMLRSPRDAAQQAIVYRRRRAERPTDRALRIAGAVGALLVHLLVLFGAILGPAYDYQEPINRSEPLQVRLIEQPEPPPPPPVRGTPPKRVGPVHRGSATAARTRPAEPTPALPPTPAMASPQMPVITLAAPPATIRIAKPAAPTPPLALPHPQPSPELPPVPLAGTPPRVNLDTPPTAHPVPPKFQPEPLRKPQLDGSRPMPPPPSLAMPAVPVEAPPPTPVPSVALDHIAAPDTRPPSTLQLVQPQPAATPVAPQVEPIPLPAQAAPTITLTPQLSPPAPSVAREQPRVQAPTIQLAEPQLVATPPQATAAAETPLPATPTVELPKLAPPAISATQAPAAPPSPAAPPIEVIAPTIVPTIAPTGEATSPESGNDTRQANTPSSAPVATAQGSDVGSPGAQQGAAAEKASSGAIASTPHTGQGKGQGEGKQGKRQPGADEGSEHGQLGSYIQLKPHGDTQIMDHRAPDIGYKPTRFEDDWAPENESSLDTALRHAIDKTTVKHTFHLPRGVRVKCDLSVLRLFAPFGCGSADPPAKGGTPEQYQRLNLAPVKSLDPTPAASAASAAAPAAPIHLDNAAQCAAARVSGGPLPPGCADDTAPAAPPARTPAAASSSWVPASDQFH